MKLEKMLEKLLEKAKPRYARFCDKVESIDDDTAEKYTRRLFRGINFASGIALATIDVVTTGYPYLSIGYVSYDLLGRLISIPKAEAMGLDPWMFVDDKKEFFKELGKCKLIYLAGASVPFSIKYPNEIVEMGYHLIDKLMT